MKRIIEDNYLGFRLEITIDSSNKTVAGALQEVYQYPWGECDTNDIYNATAVCREPDKFNELKGIKLVKLKLAKQYHSDMKYLFGDAVRNLKKLLRDNETELNHHLKKLNNIENTMKKEYEMTFKKNVKKPSKNSTSTKTGKKKSK